jgi:hypothetical protein
MTGNDFRRIALGMTGAIEGAHMGHPDFRANGRIFATLRLDETIGMVGLRPEHQQELITEHPDVFSPESGAWGRAGATRVALAGANEEIVGEAMTLAWKRVMQLKRASGSKAKGSKVRKSVSATSRSARKRPSGT